MHRKALGKGLDALFKSEFPDQNIDEKSPSRRIITVSVNDILPNPEQPRDTISGESLEELKQSIAENGILEPPVVRRKGEFFELIAGERRFRAAKDLKFETIEVILMDVDSDEKMLILSIIENIQREDLNAIEEGRAYRQIMKRMEITQEELADIVGKNRSTIANTLRLLTLAAKVQKMVSDGQLAPGSARALITVQDDDLQFSLAHKIASEGLSARKAEQLVKKTLSHEPHVSSPSVLSPALDSFRENLQRVLGTSVKIKGNESKGKIEIAYSSKDELEHIFESIKDGTSIN
ncbi:MAG: ParB/RepB/Spo0J family partition protein [Candidatus Latescibacteria bacterium]|nr:ParB/RepB/Spo0J family partition protein [Candidatus Latescibacterota bacterium]